MFVKTIVVDLNCMSIKFADTPPTKPLFHSCSVLNILEGSFLKQSHWQESEMFIKKLEIQFVAIVATFCCTPSTKRKS